MTIRKLSALGALTFTLLAATHGSAAPSKTLDVRVGGVDITQGKVRALLLSGADQGVLPGDKGFFTKDGAKVPGSDFEVYRIGDRTAWTMTSFATTDELRFRTSLRAKIATTRSCASSGKKPDLGASRDVALGRRAPKGFDFATVMSTEPATDTSFSFTIDKGTDDGVMPASYTYAILAGTGAPLPYAVDVTWATATTAGGTVRNVGTPDDVAKVVRKIAFEKITCRK